MQALCLELLKANGSWGHALKSADDHIDIDVSWNALMHRVTMDYRAA